MGVLAWLRSLFGRGGGDDDGSGSDDGSSNGSSDDSGGGSSGDGQSADGVTVQELVTALRSEVHAGTQGAEGVTVEEFEFEIPVGVDIVPSGSGDNTPSVKLAPGERDGTIRITLDAQAVRQAGQANEQVIDAGHSIERDGGSTPPYGVGGSGSRASAAGDTASAGGASGTADATTEPGGGTGSTGGTGSAGDAVLAERIASLDAQTAATLAAAGFDSVERLSVADTGAVSDAADLSEDEARRIVHTAGHLAHGAAADTAHALATLGLGVSALAEKNPIDLVEAVERAGDDESSALPAGFELSLYDAAALVDAARNTTQSSGGDTVASGEPTESTGTDGSADDGGSGGGTDAPNDTE